MLLVHFAFAINVAFAATEVVCNSTKAAYAIFPEDSRCFLEDKIGPGWTTGPISAGFETDFTLYADTDECWISKGGFLSLLCFPV
jgi:hypothetical protein